jgi:hypothetical protein
LNEAIKKDVISVSKASRVASILTAENAASLIEFAEMHNFAQIEREVARRNPKLAKPDKIKSLSEDLSHLEVTVARKTLEKLRRAQSLEAARGKRNLGEVLDAVLDEYLKHKDPVKKAERALARKTQPARGLNREKLSASSKAPSESPAELCVHRVNASKRVSLTAEQKHQVMARDRGRCTHVDHSGNRCESERWLHIHHINPVSQGGGNEPANLTTLCSFHHDLVHQLSLPLEGQVTWLRSPRARYG